MPIKGHCTICTLLTKDKIVLCQVYFEMLVFPIIVSLEGTPHLPHLIKDYALTFKKVPPTKAKKYYEAPWN